MRTTAANFRRTDSPSRLAGLVWRLAATRRSVYIHQMNRVKSCNDFGHDDSTIGPLNIVMAIIIIIIGHRWQNAILNRTCWKGSATLSLITKLRKVYCWVFFANLFNRWIFGRFEQKNVIVSRAFSSSFSSVLARQAKCTRQPRSCL